MPIIKSPDFGLQKFMETYHCQVRERTVNGYTVLRLESSDPSYHDPHDGYGEIEIVLAADGQLKGAREINDAGVSVGIVGKEIWGYRTRLQPSWLLNLVIAGGDERGTFQVGMNRNPHRRNYDSPENEFMHGVIGSSYETADASVEYVNRDSYPDFFSPLSMTIGEDEMLVADHGLTEIADIFRGLGRHVRLQEEFTLLPEEIVQAKREMEGRVILVQFPLRIPTSDVLDIDNLLRTDTDWLRLPEQKPIILYSIQSEPSKA